MPLAQNGAAAIHWEQFGTGDPLLLIMGLGGSSQAWYRLLPHLQASGRRVILFDNRGTGASDRIRGAFTLRDMVGDARAVMDAAGVTSADVLGVSMGGMVAQQLALSDRSRVRSLILGCTTANARSGVPPWRLLAAPWMRSLSPQRALALITPALYARTTREQHPERIREDFVVRVREATPPHTLFAQMLAIAGHDARRRLPELAALPVTVVHGDQDALVPLRRGRELAALIPGAVLNVIGGAGHMLLTDAEDASAGAIRAHLERVAASAQRAA